MATEDFRSIKKRIDDLQEGIFLMHGEISMVQDGETESSMWSQVGEMEREVDQLKAKLPVEDTASEEDTDSETLFDEQAFETMPERGLVLLDDVYLKLEDEFRKNPKLMTELDSRLFEEFTMHVLTRFKFECELTPASRDGGFDIYAYYNTGPLRFLTCVECKRYKHENKVGIGTVNNINGVRDAIGADKAMIVTTSFFTSPAIERQKQISTKLELADYSVFKKWLAELKDRKPNKRMESNG